MGFQSYMDDVRSQLTCNAPDSEHVTFGFTEEQIRDERLYFFRCFRKSLSPYKALTFFRMHLNEKSQCPN